MGDLISIIVPVYNVESYLEQCIDSILAQSYKNLEIILVDDGSTDRSGDICDRYAEKDSRIHVVHKANGGLSSARNAGLKICHGDYLGFVDSDDYIDPDMYKVYWTICFGKTRISVLVSFTGLIPIMRRHPEMKKRILFFRGRKLRKVFLCIVRLYP